MSQKLVLSTKTSRRFIHAMRDLCLGEIVPVLLAVVVMTIAGRVAVPFYPIPATLQTLGALSLAFIQRPSQSILSMMTWLTLGALNAPVFAFGRGAQALHSVNAGYILAMAFLTPLTSYAFHLLRPKASSWSSALKASRASRVATVLVALGFSMGVVAGGSFVLALIMGLPHYSFFSSFVVFIPGEMAKIAFGVLVLWSIERDACR